MDRGVSVLRYMTRERKDVIGVGGPERKTGGNTDRRRLTVTQEAFSSFPNHPNFALGTAQSQSIHGHPCVSSFRLLSRILIRNLLFYIQVDIYRTQKVYIHIHER